MVAGLVCWHFFVVPSIPCSTSSHSLIISTLRSPAVSLLSLIFLRQPGMYNNWGPYTQCTYDQGSFPFRILMYSISRNYVRTDQALADLGGVLELVSAFLESGRAWIGLNFVVNRSDPQIIGCAFALQRLRCSLMVGLISSGMVEEAGNELADEPRCPTQLTLRNFVRVSLPSGSRCFRYRLAGSFAN